MVKVHANSHAGEVDPLGETESQEGSQPGSPKPIVVGEIKVSGDDAAISAPATLIYSTNFYTKNGQARSLYMYCTLNRPVRPRMGCVSDAGSRSTIDRCHERPVPGGEGPEGRPMHGMMNSA